jgi:hypothetical protein
MVADRPGQADLGEDRGDALATVTPMIIRASAMATLERSSAAAALAFAVAQGRDHLTDERSLTMDVATSRRTSRSETGLV